MKGKKKSLSITSNLVFTTAIGEQTIIAIDLARAAEETTTEADRVSIHWNDASLESVRRKPSYGSAYVP